MVIYIHKGSYSDVISKNNCWKLYYRITGTSTIRSENLILAKKMASKSVIKKNKNDMNMSISINFKSLRNIVLNIKCLNFSILFFILKKYSLTKFLNEFKMKKIMKIITY